ncbi:GDP-mannose 4,6-dehydratase [Asticcacaulis sp. W401b]|uniref:GDP-mannose 4,6-dehydratase n=1 Tax=Asticcacaulis sp. W401b TaxID=3388666 RepID=UPI003970476F
MSNVVITGVTGQDGAYLAELLLGQGHVVYGTYRRTSTVNLWRLQELGIDKHPNLKLVEYDLLDQGSAIRLLDKAEPEKVFNLAAQSFVGVSFDQPYSTAMYTGASVTNLLEGIRTVNKDIRFYQASSSELYGLVQEVPQKETTPFYPRSPYAVAKLYGHWITVNYRESYGMFASSGILFNHESPMRGQEFVTRKITNAVAQIHLGQLDVLELGNIDAKRDWGHAREYVEGMNRMLDHNAPDTFVLATNVTTTIRSFVEMAFKNVDVDVVWEGQAEQETARCAKTGKVLVRINPQFYRPAEVELLIGDPSKAEAALGWKAQTQVHDLCSEMVAADLERNKNGRSF